VDALAEVRKLIGPAPEGGWPRELLMEHLYALHDAYRGLYKRHLLALSYETGVPMAQVARVATSCRDFEILAEGQAAPAATVRVCEGLSCDMAGAGELLQRLPALIDGVNAVGVPCLGYCDHAPAVLVGRTAVPHATPEEILNAVMHDRSRSVFREAQAPAVSALVDYKEYCDDGGYALAAAVANGEEDAEFVLHALDEAGLCDLGGTGMPVGAAWRRVRQQALQTSTAASLVVDLSEFESGSFKDRHCLERDPHRFLEGLLVAAHIVGADAAHICLRKDHHPIRVLLEAELAALAADPPCRLPRIELRRGAPPAGPTALAQSLETLYWLRDILRRGPRWFTDFGRHGGSGLRMFSVSGRVANPGVKVAPAGITPRELVDEYCGGMAEGHELHTYVAGGTAGTVIVAGQGDKARLRKFFPGLGG
jgi:formate dehydrogenase beta subunit